MLRRSRPKRLCHFAPFNTQALHAFYFDLLSDVTKFMGSHAVGRDGRLPRPWRPEIMVCEGFAQQLNEAVGEVEAAGATPDTVAIFQRKMGACLPKSKMPPSARFLR